MFIKNVTVKKGTICRCYFTEENIQYYLGIAQERFIKKEYEKKRI